jgi:hypothetical protein
VTAFTRRKKFGLRNNLADQIGELSLPIQVVGFVTRTMNNHITGHRWDVSICIDIRSRRLYSVLKLSYRLPEHTTVAGDATVGIPSMLGLMGCNHPLRDLGLIIPRHSLAFFIISFNACLPNKIDFIQTDIIPIPLFIQVKVVAKVPPGNDLAVRIVYR